MILKTDLEKYGITLNEYCEFLGIEVDSFTYSNKIKSLSTEFEDKNNVFNYLALNVFNLANNFLAQMPEKLKQDSFNDFKNIVGDINAENLRRCVFEEIKFRVINNILPELAYKKYFNGNLNYNADQNWNYQSQENFLNPQAILYLKNSNWNATIDNFEDYRLGLSDKQDKLSVEQLEAIEAVKNKANISDLEAKQDKLSPELFEKISNLPDEVMSWEQKDTVIDYVLETISDKDIYVEKHDFKEHEAQQNRKVEALNSKVESLENRPNLTADQLEAIEAVKNKADLSDLTEKFRELSGQIDELGAQKLNSTDLDIHLSPINAELEKLKNLSQSDEKINNLVERLGSAQGQVSTLIESSGEFENQISELNEKVQNLENSNQNYAQRFTTLSSQIETSKSNDDANIQRLEQAITNATTELNNTKRKTSQLESALTVNTEADAETLNKFNKLNAEYSKNLQTVRNDILTNNQSISNLVRTVEEADSAIKNRLAVVESQGNRLNSSKAEKSEIEQIKRDVASLKSRDSASNNGHINTLNSKVSILERNVENLTGKVNSKSTILDDYVEFAFDSSSDRPAGESDKFVISFSIQIGDREFEEVLFLNQFKHVGNDNRITKSYFSMIHSKGVGVIVEYSYSFYTNEFRAFLKDSRTLYNDSNYNVGLTIRNIRFGSFWDSRD